MKLIGIQFTGVKRDGDFAWMIQQPQYAKALFIFNDNVEHHKSSIRGKGSAVIRPFNAIGCPTAPRSFGISTGYSIASGGFVSFTDTVQFIIDDELEELAQLVARHTYDTIYFSADADGHIGTHLFRVHPDVLAYIEDGVRDVVSARENSIQA